MIMVTLRVTVWRFRLQHRGCPPPVRNDQVSAVQSCNYCFEAINYISVSFGEELFLINSTRKRRSDLFKYVERNA